ncbi:MAG: ADP-forming succinate--CoA ligase subunit beta [Candidatus Porifericomitaceae bacterium WSBS_2022_MAG_OTU9]
MNLHEYQAKALMSEYGIPVTRGRPAKTVEEAIKAAAELGGDGWVVKAQVHAGGRGKAGGVQLVQDSDKLKTEAQRLLGSRLVTHQSGSEGKPVEVVLIEKIQKIKREMYLSMLLDRSSRQLAIIASPDGGMDIEKVAAETPERIYTSPIPTSIGVMPHQVRNIGKILDLDKQQRQELQQLLHNMHRMFMERDLSLVEINPLAIDSDNQLLVLDAKISVDDNAAFRQKELAAMYDHNQDDPREIQARQHQLNYIRLSGQIGCMVNGAGLAMATMDVISLHGGQAANFLDVGGGTTTERVSEAFRIISSDNQVRSILVNIFGGIVRCDMIAKGIIEAVQKASVKLPIVVRLEGTKAKEGLAMLGESGLELQTATDLGSAAQLAIAAANGKKN